MSYQATRKYEDEMSGIYPVKKKRIRKINKKQQIARLRFLVLMFFVLSFILPKVFLESYNNLFFNRIRNSFVEIPSNRKFFDSYKKYYGKNSLVGISPDVPFFRSFETYWANDYFLGTKFLGDVNTGNPLMTTPRLSGEMTVLTSRLKALAAQFPSINPGIFIYDYTTGKHVNINADKSYPTASMIKLPVLLELYRRAEAGGINLNEEMKVPEYYLTEGSGYLQYQLGRVLTIHNLARLMIQESDNTATNMLLANIGGVNEMNRALRSWGFGKTSFSNWLPDLYGTNIATPMDYGTMLYNIDNHNFLSLESRANIVEIMSHVRNRFLIQASLPDNVNFIHKTGDIGEMLGDGGIVILPDGRKYIVVIMVKRPWNSFSAKQFIIDASKVIYNSYETGDV